MFRILKIVKTTSDGKVTTQESAKPQPIDENARRTGVKCSHPIGSKLGPQRSSSDGRFSKFQPPSPRSPTD